MNPHLTDEQIYELLDGDASCASPAGVSAHLAQCARCRTELDAVRASLSNFRQATVSLAASLPLDRGSRATLPHHPWWHVYARHGLAASVATAIVLLGAGLTSLHPLRPAPALPAATHPGHALALPSTVSDDELLDGIDRDLSVTVPPSLEPLTTSSPGSAVPSSSATNN